MRLVPGIPLAPATAIVSIAALLSIGAPAMAAPTPQRLAEQYCGLYNKRTLQTQYHRVTSVSLSAALDDTLAKLEHYEQQYPGTVPPLGNGLPFTSFDDLGRCNVGRLSRPGGHTRIEVNYRIRGGPPERDHLVLRKEQGGWKIDDIARGGPAYYATLRRQLESAFSLEPLATIDTVDTASTIETIVLPHAPGHPDVSGGHDSPAAAAGLASGPSDGHADSATGNSPATAPQ